MCAFVLAIMGLGLYRRLKRKPSILLNLLTVAAAGVLGNSTTGFLGVAMHLDRNPLWSVRIPGAALLHVALFLLVNGIRASTIERNEEIRKLEQREAELRGYRESAREIATDELDRLRENSRNILLPHIEKIEELVAERFERKMRNDLLAELQSLIDTEVRPLSRAIMSDAEAFAAITEPRVETKVGRPRWRTTFVPSHAIYPLMQMLIVTAGFPMLEFVMIDHRSAFRGLISGISVGIMLAIIRACMSRTKEAHVFSGLAQVALVSVLSTLPTWWIMWQEYGLTNEVIRTGLVITGINILITFFVSYIHASDLARERYARQLATVNLELAKEVALFEQKLALNRRDWSRIIHGDVQASLSAALTRLRRSSTPEPYEFELIKSNIEHAKQALLGQQQPAVSFDEAMNSLISSWASVCQISVSLSARAKRALEISSDARACVNEICKEAISNAVRHGDAKVATIELDRQLDDLLELSISNDGSSISGDAEKGMGSGMIGELTLSWSIESIPNGTRLHALIPLQRS